MKKNYFTVFIMYILVFFPYIKIIDVLGSDTQINAVVFSTIVILGILIKIKIRIPKNCLYFLCFLCLAIIIALLIKPINMYSLRQLFTYYTLFVVTYASYFFLKKDGGLNEKYLKIIIWIWMMTGFIQSYINPGFLTFLLPRITGGGERGVIALAPEPTYYASICILLLFFVLKFKKNKSIYLLLLIVQAVFFAKSSMISFFLILGVIFYILAISNIKTILQYVTIALVSLTLAVGGILVVLPDSRMSQNIVQMIEDPISLIKKDASINQRLGHVYYSLKGTVDNYLLPHGYNQVDNYFKSQTSEIFNLKSYSKLMSGYGVILFELGIIGIGIIVVIHKSLNNYFDSKKKNFYFNIYVALFLFTAIPLSNPIISFLIAYGTYLKNSRDEI